MSRLGEGAKQIVSKYMAQLETNYLVEFCSTTCPMTALSRKFLKLQDYNGLVLIAQGREIGP